MKINETKKNKKKTTRTIPSITLNFNDKKMN